MIDDELAALVQLPNPYPFNIETSNNHLSEILIKIHPYPFSYQTSTILYHISTNTFYAFKILPSTGRSSKTSMHSL